MIRFSFRERKTAQAAAHLLKLAGGQMYYILLLKLLYLADRQSLIDVGHPITGDGLVSMDSGPVLSQTYNLISEEPNPFFGFGQHWNEYITQPAEYKVHSRKPEPENDELSKYQLNLLNNIYRAFGGWDRWELIKWTHKLPEWQDPHGSSAPIEPEKILRSVGKSEDQIRRIHDEAEATGFTNSLLIAQ